jgi:hypothetical protein
MRPIVRKWLALVAASVGLYLVLPDRGLAQSITVATLKGTYVTTQTGSITVNGTVYPITLAAVLTFFGNGTASGESTYAVVIPGGSIVSGQHDTFTATYTRNADGVSFNATYRSTVNPEDVNTVVLYPTLDGSTIASNWTTAGSFLSGVFTRSSGQALQDQH